jgi:hypothetical protein
MMQHYNIPLPASKPDVVSPTLTLSPATIRVDIVHTLCHVVVIATPTEEQRSMANVSQYLTTPYIETDCTVTHEGRTFEAGGAAITGNTIIAYVGAKLDDRRPIYALTTWHGERIGTVTLTSSWRTPRSYVSSHMHQGLATLLNDPLNRVFTGRTAGEGMAFRGRLVRNARED